jgi:hypothetical protein
MEGSLRASLVHLEQQLRQRGAVVAAVLRQGIEESEVSSRLAALDLRPTSELLTWFGWHNGAGDTSMPREHCELAPGAEFHDLDYLCSEYSMTRRVAAELAAQANDPQGADRRWPRTWFPLIRLFGKGYIAVDLASDSSTTDVHVAWHDDAPDKRSRVAWRGVNEMVEWIGRQYDAGVFNVNEDGIVDGQTIDFPGD